VPVITGTAQEGQTLIATASLTTDESGQLPSYQWQSSIDGTTGWTVVGTGDSYMLGAGDAGKYLRVVASYTDDTGQSTTATSAIVNVPGVSLAEPAFITTLDFGATRVGAAPVTEALTIGNGTVADPAQESLGYTVSPTAPFIATGVATGAIASGTTGTIDLAMQTGAAGNFNGSSLPITLTSLGEAFGLPDTPLGAQTVTLNGRIYAPAVAQLGTSSLSFGIVHVHDIVSRQLTVTNVATGALTDVLTGGFGSVSAPFQGSGSLAGVAAAATGALTVSLNTGSAGAFSGTATLALQSYDAELADASVTASPVALTGTVDNYAVAAITKVSGGASLTQSGQNYVLNLGSAYQGTSFGSVTLGVLNAAPGLADLLSGSFSVSGSSAFTNFGFGPFSGLAAGQSETAQSISLATTSSGTYTETITLSPTGSNASGYSGTLAPETVTVTGTVLNAYVLGKSVVTASAPAFVATDSSLISGDRLTGSGSSGNTLVLYGGGTFNLAAPTTLANIQVITAQEGQGATAQRVTLRAGLNATVNVASDPVTTDTAPTIAIIGAANTDVINLGSGNDTVTLGAGEKVYGGGGRNSFSVAAASLAGVTISGGGSGNSTLTLTGGGTVTMGSNVTGIARLQLASPTTFTASVLAGLQIAGSSAGGDTIVLAAPTQSVTAGGNNELVKVSAANAGGVVVSGLAANSTLEITTGGTITLNANTNVTTVKIDAASTLVLNSMQFITAVGSAAADTIQAGGNYQTLTGGTGVDTLIGYTVGSTPGYDTFRDTAAGLNGDLIKGFLNTDTIDITNLLSATISAVASGANTLVTATSGATKSVFTIAGSWSQSGFTTKVDAVGTGTLITHN